MTTTKQAYQEKLQAQLSEIEAQINVWRAKVEQAEADAKLESQKHLENLEQRRDDIRAKLEELSNAGEGAWEDLKAGIDSAWDDLKRAFEDAAARFRD